MNKVKRPSDPPPTARLCENCKHMKDDTGMTYGWGLCHCGSFRLPTPRQTADKP